MIMYLNALPICLDHGQFNACNFSPSIWVAISSFSPLLVLCVSFLHTSLYSCPSFFLLTFLYLFDALLTLITALQGFWSGGSPSMPFFTEKAKSLVWEICELCLTEKREEHSLASHNSFFPFRSLTFLERICKGDKRAQNNACHLRYPEVVWSLNYEV